MLLISVSDSDIDSLLSIAPSESKGQSKTTRSQPGDGAQQLGVLVESACAGTMDIPQSGGWSCSTKRKFRYGDSVWRYIHVQYIH